MRLLLVTGLVLGALVVLSAQVTSAADSKSCVPRGSNGKGHYTRHPAAKRTVERYATRTLERCDGVEGMGVGALGDRPPKDSNKVWFIEFYLRDSDSMPPNTRSIAGVRIIYVITGPIEAQ
jgi:hypothetical protein